MRAKDEARFNLLPSEEELPERKFGNVHLHRDLFIWGEDTCFGGGFWTIDHSRNAIILYGESYDFGGPDFTRIKQIKWSVVGGKPCSLLYAPHYPNLDTLEPVFANP